MRYPFLAMAAAAFLAACQTGQPSPAAVAKVDPGPRPAQYREVVQRWLDGRLKDPHSVQDLRIGEPTQGVFFKNLWEGNVGIWRVCFGLNAKNGFGGYTGFRTYSATFRDGRVLTNTLGVELIGPAPCDV